ncbi:MAG: IPT/TIG domain-containing protein [Dysgonamonadaceae bacterium]|jgi:hypothetical protein|nr:IPT/TIG domain-containing protein [Dysgonamonadaceae bacterium]
MTKKFLVLFSIMNILSANLRAQVTFGALTPPVPGAILDLNSTNKGGLILSNVALTDLSAIPSSFPKANVQDAALKNGMIGALIYNTNENTCIGIHAWNGDYWERIAANFIVTQDTLLSSSNAAIAFGDDTIKFTASLPGAKSYRWYLSENDGDYKYLGITTTNTYSKDFPTGKYKLKVIMDDCHSLTESNELAFSPASISPSFGSLAGGNYIYIYGDFPYAGTGDYAAQSDLVAHYDGINNRGEGDKSHDYSAASWKDLKTGFELPRTSSAGQWLSNGFQSLNETILPTYTSAEMAVNAAFYTSNFPAAYPVGNDARTIEVIFRTPDEQKMFDQAQGIIRMILRYGKLEASKIFGILYRGETRVGCTEDVDNQWVFYAIAGNISNLVTCLSSTPSLEAANTINTVTSTYQDSMRHSLTNSFINNVPATIVEQSGILNTGTDFLTLGYNLPYATFLSARLYNRILTPEEIAQNAALDQKRYLSPPTVTIDGQNCTDVVVLSPHFLMCKVPPGDIPEAKEVIVNNISYGEVYEYVDPVADFYIHEISPIVGPANTANRTLTLTGNLLNTITEVKVDNIVCTDLATSNSTATCTLPFHPAGEVDITITADSETYRFVKVFEYQ